MNAILYPLDAPEETGIMTDLDDNRDKRLTTPDWGAGTGDNDSDLADHVRHATRKWIENVVVGFGFCPYAAAVLDTENALRIDVCQGQSQSDGDASSHKAALQRLSSIARQMADNPDPETVLIVMPQGLEDFDDYLDLLADAEDLLQLEQLTGVLQLASFHPDYRFDNTPIDDAANFTNRSPFPMLHILREESVEKLIGKGDFASTIPERNIETARSKGCDAMRAALRSCMEIQ